MTNPRCQLLQSRDLQVIVGDASRDGVAGRQYCGLWSMTSKHRAFNAFGNSYAGLLPSDIRGKAPSLECVDERTCLLKRQADEQYPVDAVAAYTLTDPYYVDHSLTVRDRRDVRGAGCDFREVGWCCYMNCPQDSRIHFLSGGEWFRYISPQHGVGSHIAPSYLPDAELEVFPERPEPPFHWDRIERRFDQPFYYGRLDHMVMILIFDRPRWLRFFCSPSGGGPSLLAGRTCPAWDFEWMIPREAYRPDVEYAFRLRLLYKPFVSDEDVLDEFRKAQDELGFEKVPGA